MKKILKNNKELIEENSIKRRKVGGFNNKLILSLVFIALLSLFFAFIFNPQGFKPTGHAVLTVTTTYLPNETLKGGLALSLKAGELIPSDSLVSIKIGSNFSNYSLSSLISESTTTGNYYIVGSNLSGSGEGYGIIGEKVNYPEVSFTMKITSSGNSEGTSTGETSTETTQEQNTTETSSTPETINPTQESTTDTSTNSGTEATQPANTEITNPSSSTTTETSTTPETTQTKEEIKEEKIETKEEKATEKETAKEEKAQESVAVPENSGNGGGEASITGQVSAELINEISGVTSKENPYTYNLEAGQTAEIISSDQPVTLTIENGVATVKTEYSTSEQGFGEGYSGDTTYDININLSSLNLNPEEGEMVVSIISQNTEILSVTNNLVILESSTVSNETLIENLTANITIQEENLSDYALSDEQKFKLKMITGSEDVKITKSETLNDRLIVRFEIGDYWIEKTYDAELSVESLRSQIALDKVKWTKYLAQKLMEVTPSPVDAPEYVENLTG